MWKRNTKKNFHKKKSMRKKKSYRKRSMKGGCGCSSSSLMKGGNINPASFNSDLPIRYFYGQNSYANDPSDPSVVENSRNLPAILTSGGGKKRKTKMIRRKMRGGDVLTGSSFVNNPFMTFGTIDGATNSVNILYGNQTVNPSVYDQPISKGFNFANPPLA